MTALITSARRAFHERLVAEGVLSVGADNIASNADRSQGTSRTIALGIVEQLGAAKSGKHAGQRAGKLFESAVADFIADTFPHLQRLRPGNWRVANFGSSRREYQLSRFVPYTHLASLASAIEHDSSLSTILGNSYEISPDIVVLRHPESDPTINRDQQIVDDKYATLSPIRERFQTEEIVHAVISCKWTLRSDRAQNARAEALNLIRNRKGRTPHISVVTAEPTPSRIASLALGTGDMDIVYHFALPELRAAIVALGNDEVLAMLDVLIDGNRLRDISDLPLDLAI